MDFVRFCDQERCRTSDPGLYLVSQIVDCSKRPAIPIPDGQLQPDRSTCGMLLTSDSGGSPSRSGVCLGHNQIDGSALAKRQG